MLLKIRLENLCHTVVQDQAPLKSPAFLQKQGRILRAKIISYTPPAPLLTNLQTYAMRITPKARYKPIIEGHLVRFPIVVGEQTVTRDSTMSAPLNEKEKPWKP